MSGFHYDVGTFPGEQRAYLLTDRKFSWTNLMLASSLALLRVGIVRRAETDGASPPLLIVGTERSISLTFLISIFSLWLLGELLSMKTESANRNPKEICVLVYSS